MIVTEAKKRFLLTISEEVRRAASKLLHDVPVTLASSSPRRREILRLAGIECRVVVPVVDEEPIAGTDPAEFAMLIAKRKLDVTPAQVGITVAADTIVVLQNQILGKPVDQRDAKRILRMLAGRRHTVITALAVRDDKTGKVALNYGESFVTFNDLSDDEIAAYVESGEPMDKAGAYGIQGMGEFLVERLEGSLHNVVGFPIELFVKLVGELRG